MSPLLRAGLAGPDKGCSWGPAILRVVVGLIFVAHGVQKILVLGVDGLSGFLASVGVPAPALAAVALIVAETVGGLLLIAGALTRPAAAVLAFVMLVALFSVHLADGFFVNPGAGANGIEYVLALFAASVAIALT
ncbi:MAG: DoxX family protein, partial [Gemmatimonadota bacterium]|nr:DoxX family protein [Gemmatimonadota bacterium]